MTDQHPDSGSNVVQVLTRQHRARQAMPEQTDAAEPLVCGAAAAG